MAEVSGWGKFKLLLWKNWILQWSHKIQAIVQLLVPAFFLMLIVVLRILLEPQHYPVSTYPALPAESLKTTKRLLTIVNALYSGGNRTASRKDRLRHPNFEVLYSPKNDMLDKIIAGAASTLFVTYEGVADAATLQESMDKRNSFAGVQFDDSLKDITDYPTSLTYALCFPAHLRTSYQSVSTWSTNMLFASDLIHDERNVKDPGGGHPACYRCEGFLALQHAVAMSYIKLKSKKAALPEVFVKRFPYPEYDRDRLLLILETSGCMIIVLSYIYPCTNLARHVTYEKEKQLKEVMKIMGLHGWLHWLAWFVKAMIIFTMLSILIVVMLKIEWLNGFAVLSKSSSTALFFVFMVYSIASTTFCFMLAVFFSKASTAAATIGVIWFVAHIPFSVTLSRYANVTMAEKYTWCLLSNSALGFAFRIIIGFELSGEGLQWDNFYKRNTPYDPLTLGDVLMMMLISAILYMLICLYVEQVFPGDFGIAKKWNFPFTRAFWYRRDEDDDSSSIASVSYEPESVNVGAFEAEPMGREVGVELRDLRKSFREKEVVKGISLNLYESDITVLLGHNGAGKTTTISMLIGMFPPTSGSAIINGHDIRTDLEAARQSLGICPQHNVLFDDISVANHIVFYSRLKGLRKPEVRDEIDKYLGIIGLEDKANVSTLNLSSGMKRKLSLCCALCGNTKVVICDEPSSGMDPAARRQLWDLIQSERKGRTILLTTHYMDEADLLGDRIAIMADGKLKCCGTSFFLKKRFGYGYRLICSKRPGCNVAAVTALIRKYIPGIQPTSDVGTELTYQLYYQYVAQFQGLFRDLEQNAENLKLEGYGIGQTSLEDVFMRVGAEVVDEEAENNATTSNLRSGSQDDDPEETRKKFEESSRKLRGFNLLWYQGSAMFIKNFAYFKRKKILLLTQLVIPISLILLVIISEESQISQTATRPITIGLNQYISAFSALETPRGGLKDNDMMLIAKSYETVAESGPKYHFRSTGGKSMTDFILSLAHKSLSPINWQYLVGATIYDSNKIIAWFNNQAFHTAPLALNLVHNAIAKTLIDDDTEITVINQPTTDVANIDKELSKLGNVRNLGFQVAINLSFAMSFVTAFYIVFLIKERVSRAKLMQLVGGVRIWMFWITQFLWNLLTFAFVILVTLFVFSLYQATGYSTVDEISRVFLVFLVFGFSALPFTYFMSNFFAEPANGFAILSITSILIGQGLFILVVSLSLDTGSARDAANSIRDFCSVYPHFTLAMALYMLQTNSLVRESCNVDSLKSLGEKMRCTMVPDCCNITPYFGEKDPGILTELIYMIAVGVIFMVIIMIWEYGWIKSLLYKICVKKRSSNDRSEVADEDVAREEKQIREMTKEDLAKQNLVLDGLSKYFKRVVAVDHISMCVKSKECFGLVGVNGAGKTLTFRMMTGDMPSSGGKIYIKGMNLSTHLKDIYQDIGYCPQSNAILEDLSGRETLKIFCLLRGIRPSRITEVSENLAKGFGFSRHIDKPAKVYSGGNKRKLNVAIAVIGSPSLVFLDDPTAGMDPAARRQLWGMVSALRDSGKSVVLTSHSMEECEALCTRLAIMVNGKFMCIGSSQYLKQKFQKGFVLKIMRRTTKTARGSTVVDAASEKIKQFVNKNFPTAVLQEEYEGILTYHIPVTNVKWSTIFGLMEQNKSNLQIDDYSINQTTLEEIFLGFAAPQQTNSHH